MALCHLDAGAFGAEVWFCAIPPVLYSRMHHGAQSDFQSLFEQNAPWAHAAAGVQVFKIFPQYAQTATDDQLRQLIADLQRRHIALAMAAGIVASSGPCGRNVEGYGGQQIVNLAGRIRRLGGDIRYLAMDEPLWFGHQYAGRDACHTTIPELARNVAINVAAFKRLFPSAEVGDSEPFGSPVPAGWVDQIIQWAQAYQAATGTPLAFLDLDMNWRGPWRQQLEQLVPWLRTTHIKYGMIYNGEPDDLTDVEWTRHAEEHFSEVESDPQLVPDQAIVETWMAHPTRVLPETQPGTMTWLANRYLAKLTRLTLRRADSRLDGELTDSGGRPVAGAKIDLSAEVSAGPSFLALHQRSGQVPTTAATALFALRINTECSCSGTADVQIQSVAYRDNKTGQAVGQTFRQPSASGVDMPMSAHFAARPNQKVATNTSNFPVSAGDPFTAQVAMAADSASSDSGYVALIFVDAEGKGIERVRLPFRPIKQIVRTVTTDAQGRFSLALDATTLRRSVAFQAEYSGDTGHRLAIAITAR
jgi:hypothetical protein